ncbi:MAG TPA: hypothetical protein VG942_09840 [Hyphomonadaceae bacterium]|nr:hypothetical protein [Hyphomonadaceae bacterium]
MLRFPTHALFGASLLCAVLACAAGPASAQIVLGGKQVDDPNAPTPSPAITGITAPASNGALLNLDAPDFQPLAIAVPAFAASTDAEKQLATKIVDLLNKDLTNSGDFKSLDPATFAAETVDVSVAPAYANWAGLGAQALVVGKVIINPTGSVRIQFRVFDTATGKQLVGTEYSMPVAEAWARLAHKIADDIYEKTTGEAGYFDSRIVFVADPGPKAKLGLMDQDGANASLPLTDVPSLQAPRFARSGEFVVYSADAPNKSGASQLTTGLFTLASGRREQLVIGSPQPNPDARFSPDGRSIAYSRNENGNADLFLLDAAKRTDVQLTKTPGAESGPTFSPDGRYVAFATASGVSVARADGQQATSISTGAYRSPTWSPAGGWIAFEEGGKIGVMKSDGSAKRLLTQGPSDSSPSWSPNGRVLVFARRDGSSSKLWTIEVSGRNLRELPTATNAAQPDWGPKLR